jgi:hypothetical protein
MAKEHIIFDKTEIIVAVVGDKNAHLENIKYSDIINVTFKLADKKPLFGEKPELIVIKTKRNSITLNQKQEKKFWDGYKAGLEKFCADNRLTLHNELNG